MQTLLKVSGLEVQFIGPKQNTIYAVNGANLELRPGEVLGLLGESGSGKSTLAKTPLRLLPRNARITKGKIEFEGRDLLALQENDLERIRGARIAMIWQEPGLMLNPVMKVGDQIGEVIRAHFGGNSKRRKEDVRALLERVQLNVLDSRIYDAYPHQLSGGQLQRIAIAQSLACQPSLLMADEPTASLDAGTEEEILQLLRKLKIEQAMSLLLITHDPKILVGLADRVAVMYGGRIVEEGSLNQVFQQPRHPYTQALLACIPHASEGRTAAKGMRLPTIEGSCPDPESVSTGCSFAPRCKQRLEVCEERIPSPVESDDGRRVECFLYDV